MIKIIKSNTEHWDQAKQKNTFIGQWVLSICSCTTNILLNIPVTEGILGITWETCFRIARKQGGHYQKRVLMHRGEKGGRIFSSNSELGSDCVVLRGVKRSSHYWEHMEERAQVSTSIRGGREQWEITEMEEFSSDEKDRLQACVSVVEAELRSAGSLDRTWSSRDRRHGGSGQQEWGGCRGVGCGSWLTCRELAVAALCMTSHGATWQPGQKIVGCWCQWKLEPLKGRGDNVRTSKKCREDRFSSSLKEPAAKSMQNTTQ